LAALTLLDQRGTIPAYARKATSGPFPLARAA